MSDYRELFDALEPQLTYGAVISGAEVRARLGVVYPEIHEGDSVMALKRQLDACSLQEMGAMDYVRNILLGRGMYLAQKGGDYYILLPSENAAQIDSYMRVADKKLRRALKLSKSSPRVEGEDPGCQVQARIMMKQKGLRRRVGE